MKVSYKNIFHPAPEVERADTALRYTDILFGFVTRELFIRLQNWALLDGTVRLHLIVGSILVLGSWIGFRRSLNRSGYQLKFFNLPLFRFLADQCMLILYFRVAVLTPAPNATNSGPAATELASDTFRLVIYVFILYLLWDILGIRMARTKTKDSGGNEKPLYPAIKDSTMTDSVQASNWAGFFITLVGLALVSVLWLLSEYLGPNWLLLVTGVVLLLYRWAKEVRTTCQAS